MDALHAQGRLTAFFERLRRSRRRALLLDFDGTLAPLSSDRAHVEMYPGVRSALLSLAGDPASCHLAIVSGRPVSDLRRVARMDQAVELWGSHGLERLTVDGRCSAPAPSAAVTALLDEMSLSAGRRWAGLFERKPYGVALHVRGYPPALAEEVRRSAVEPWREAARRIGLGLFSFDGGWELRPNGAHKGMAVDRIFDELGEKTAMAYLGDDQTDEDAFRALRARGLTVLVRAEPRPSLAELWMRPPGELITFLSEWTAACLARGGAGESAAAAGGTD